VFYSLQLCVYVCDVYVKADDKNNVLCVLLIHLLKKIFINALCRYTALIVINEK